MKIHESQIASVVFLCTDHQADDGTVRPRPRATCFFVGVLEPREGVLQAGQEVARVARTPAEVYGGQTMLGLIAAGCHAELRVRDSLAFDRPA